MTKVLLFTKAFWPQIGGVETYTRLLAEGLSAGNQDDLHLVLATGTPNESNEDSFPFPVYRRPSLKSLWGLVRQADSVHLAGPVMVPLLMSLLQRKYTLVEHHGYQACCANGLLLFEPDQSVCPEHFRHGRYSRCVECTKGRLGALRAYLAVILTGLRRILCILASKNICVSRHVSQRLCLPASQVIYHGLPVPKGQSQRRRDAGKVVFAYVGRLTGEKGLPLLVRAAAILARENRSFEVRFVGDGGMRAELEESCQSLDLQQYTVFTGFLEADRLSACLDEISVVIMPSIWEETAGLAAMEQMMRGKLVIAADIGGLGEVVGEAALKFPAGDAGALASTMREVLLNPDLILQKGALARTRAMQMFDQKRMVADHLELYRSHP